MVDILVFPLQVVCLIVNCTVYPAENGQRKLYIGGLKSTRGKPLTPKVGTRHLLENGPRSKTKMMNVCQIGGKMKTRKHYLLTRFTTMSGDMMRIIMSMMITLRIMMNMRKMILMGPVMMKIIT